MLSKLAFRNAKRSLKDYLIYLITITMSFSLMFAFNLVSNCEAVVKWEMLSKLAFRNAKRSLKDYLIYLITITMSFSLMFAFNLVSNCEAVEKLSTGMDSFKELLLFVNTIIIFVVCFLINYTTKFMFEKRSKEFGTYMLLGIRKKEITKMFVLENIYYFCRMFFD